MVEQQLFYCSDTIIIQNLSIFERHFLDKIFQIEDLEKQDEAIYSRSVKLVNSSWNVETYHDNLLKIH